MESTEKVPVLVITTEFLEQLIGTPIKSFHLSSGWNCAEHFSSTLQSVEIIRGQDLEPMHIILKSIPIDASRRELVAKYHFFSKEFLIYEEWIPALKNMVEEIRIQMGLTVMSNVLPLTPTFIGGIVQTSGFLKEKRFSRQYEDSTIFKHDFLGMIDMEKCYGFQKPKNSLDYEHCRVVISELGKLHALSWIYKRRYGLSKLTERFEYMKDFLHADPVEDNLSKLIRPVIDLSLEMAKKYFGAEPCFYQKCVQLLKMDHFNLLKLFLNVDGANQYLIDDFLNIENPKTSTAQSEPWLVGCHGDCWENNLHFKYDEETGIPVEVILMDFQIFQEACPTTDIAYFLFTSASRTIRKEHEDDLLQLYHKTVCDLLESLGWETWPEFTLENLKERYSRAKFYGFSLFLVLFSLHAPYSKQKALVENETFEWQHRLMGVVEEMCQSNGA